MYGIVCEYYIFLKMCIDHYNILASRILVALIYHIQTKLVLSIQFIEAINKHSIFLYTSKM